jgi:hypothetical protein
MPCNQNCDQGRSCNCGGNKTDRAVVVISSLLLVAVMSMGYGVYKLLHITKGSQCAVEVQFSDSKATYIGTSI